MRSVPPRWLSPVPRTATYAPRGVRTTPLGEFWTRIVLITRTRDGSTFEIVPLLEFATQTDVRPAATATGFAPTAIVSVTARTRGSIRDSVPSERFAIQTAPAPTATASGSTPTPMRSTTSPLLGSTARTAPVGGDATQSSF